MEIPTTAFITRSISGSHSAPGLNYRLQEKIWLNFDARYGVGLLDVTRLDNSNVKNNNWVINVGLSFPLGTYNKTTGRLRTR